MTKALDPRTKLLIVLCLSSLGLIITHPILLTFVFLVGLLISMAFKGDFFSLIKRFKKVLYLFIAMIILQSLFTTGGEPLVEIGSVTLLTTLGFQRGFGYLMRVLIILVCGIIVATAKMRHMVQGLVQLGVPYDFAFMASIGIKFLPLLVEEIQDTFVAIELRGIDFKKLSLKAKLEIISYIFTPVFAGALMKAKKLSLSVECRGFRAYDQRTSILTLKMNSLDYLWIALTLTLTIWSLYLYLIY